VVQATERVSTPIIRFPSTLAGYEDAAAALRRLLDAHALSTSARFNVELAFEEIAINIIQHGGARDIEVAVAIEPHEAVLTFEDDGIPFDPLEQPSPELPSSIEEAQVGGLGLMLVRKMAARMTYERTARGRNRLTVAIAA
jgi:serine/threonine-protein kinase RsbW